ncbi:unnamed protein product [Linum trigynum]|uniref:Uncharacterized protein n=1 Tax=Linum trigynum TaxID=586398 RepID=A0AAV2EDF9_9ROSI
MSADGIMYEKVVINDDDSVNMMIQFLSDNGLRLAEVYVETEPVGETHSHQYSCDDGFAGGYDWGGSSSNYGGGTSAGGYGWGGTSSNYGGGSSEGGVGWEEPDGDQWPAWGPEWADIETTLRSGRTSHDQEDDVGYAGNDDHPESSYPFASSDDESEEDLRLVSEEEDTNDVDDIDDREVAFRQAPTPYCTEVPDQFLYGQNDAPDFRPMPVYNPTTNLEVGMAFTTLLDWMAWTLAIGELHLKYQQLPE